MTEICISALTQGAVCLREVFSGICLLLLLDYLSGSVVKNPPANARDTGSIPGPRRCPGEGNGNPFQDSCLGNPKDRGAWRAIVHEGNKRVKHDSVTKQQLPPSLFTTLSCLKLFCLPVYYLCLCLHVYCLCPPKQQAQLSPFLVSLIHPNCSCAGHHFKLFPC